MSVYYMPCREPTRFHGKSSCSQVRATVDRNPVVFAIPTTRARLSETHRNTGEPAPAADSVIGDSTMHDNLLVCKVSRAEDARWRRLLERRSTNTGRVFQAPADRRVFEPLQLVETMGNNKESNDRRHLLKYHVKCNLCVYSFVN
jgi:hypothetical protein